MYHAIVKRICRRNFDLVNQRDYPSVLAGCTPNIHHRFGGDHALGGERHDQQALGQWFGRLGRLCPDLALTVQDVWVKGLPNNTTAIVRWTNQQAFPDGTAYFNHGVHVISMRWGKVTAIDANEDSQAVAVLLAQLVEAGVTEAAARPISS
jgi:ketosteroid isomerase-like protein